LRLRYLDRRRLGIAADDAAGFLWWRCTAIFPFRRRHEDREQAAGKAALPRFGQIQMALLFALQKSRHRVRAAAHIQPQQRVVVAVKDRNAFG